MIVVAIMLTCVAWGLGAGLAALVPVLTAQQSIKSASSAVASYTSYRQAVAKARRS